MRAMSPPSVFSAREFGVSVGRKQRAFMQTLKHATLRHGGSDARVILSPRCRHEKAGAGPAPRRRLRKKARRRSRCRRAFSRACSFETRAELTAFRGLVSF